MKEPEVIEDRMLERIAIADDWRAAAWLLERLWPEKYEKGARKPVDDDTGVDGVDELARKRAARRSG